MKPPENVPRRIIEDEIDDIRLFNKDISELFSKAIMKNLSLNYKDRFSSVNMFKMFIYIECMIKIRETTKLRGLVMIMDRNEIIAK